MWILSKYKLLRKWCGNQLHRTDDDQEIPNASVCGCFGSFAVSIFSLFISVLRLLSVFIHMYLYLWYSKNNNSRCHEMKVVINKICEAIQQRFCTEKLKKIIILVHITFLLLCVSYKVSYCMSILEKYLFDHVQKTDKNTNKSSI